MKVPIEINSMIRSYQCCRCQNLNRGLLGPGHPTPCQHCQHERCRTCIVHHEGGSVDQSSSYGLHDSMAFSNTFAAAPAPPTSQPLERPSVAPRTSTELRAIDIERTLEDQNIMSMSASPSSLKSTPTFGIHNTTPNMMRPPPMSSGLANRLLQRNNAGHIPHIPMHPRVTSMPGGLSHTRIGDFSSKQRTSVRPVPIQLRGRRHTTPGLESMQSPPLSATSAFFPESVMSDSLSQSDFGYLPSDRSTMIVHGDDFLTGAELPSIAPVPSLEPSHIATTGLSRPAILSEKSPKRPIHRKPKAPLPPRVVNPDDPKDYKTAQNTVAARGTRQRKMESATWLLRYRDETKVYIRDLEATLAGQNERVAILERENQELRQALGRGTGGPGLDRPAQHTQYPELSSSEHGSHDDLQTASLRNAGPRRMQVPSNLLIAQGLPSIEDSLYSLSHEQSRQSIGDNPTTEPLTARPYDYHGTLASQQLEAYANVQKLHQQVPSEHPTDTDGSLCGDGLTDADGDNQLAHEHPADPSTAYDLDLGHYISWGQAQDQLALSDYGFNVDSWMEHNEANSAQDSKSPQAHQNVEEGQVSMQA